MKHIYKILIVLVLSGFIEAVEPPKTIFTTPPAPIFTDSERQNELSKRRKDVLKEMQPNSMAIFFSATPRNYAGDVDFMYRQENNFYYLTALKQKGAVLVLVKNQTNTDQFLFLPPREPANETWNGRMYSNEDATKVSGLTKIISNLELQNFIESLKNKTSFISSKGLKIENPGKILYLLLPDSEFDEEGRAEFNREWELSKLLVETPKTNLPKIKPKNNKAHSNKVSETMPKSIYQIENARPIFETLRLIKSPYEIKILQHSIDITTEAQMRSMGMVNRANWEYEVQAEVEYTFRRRNADYWGYPSIVGCGPNATTLHYVESQGEIKQGDLLLMDVGAEYDHYTADVTRTFPVNGKFTKEQADIYQIVYDAQEAAAKTIKPGSTVAAASQAATEVIKEGLLKLGLITDKNSSQHRIWYMHGWGHWLGMNVHDVGDYTTPLKPGMVMTNEPGIYIREDALDYLPDTPANKEFISKVRPIFERYKNIGVRIEDDMLVTETGVDWMTKRLPRRIDEVENFMQKASEEMKFAKIERLISPSFSMLQPKYQSEFAGLYSGFSYPSGKTIRTGWIASGNSIAQSGLTQSHKH